LETMRGLLARLDSSRKQFIANASHELRTPLFSIRGFLELLDEEELDRNTQREFIRTTREQLDRLTQLSVDLLDLSRLDVGRMPFSREPVRLSRMGRLVVQDLSAVAKKQRHRLDLLVRKEIVVLGDHEHIARIVRALVENALRHTPPGTAIWVIVSGSHDGGRINVEDAGPGIPATELNLIFERFYRIEGSFASGSGLGLSLARQLAALMNGRIDVDSNPGRTTFRSCYPSTYRRTSRDSRRTPARDRRVNLSAARLGAGPYPATSSGSAGPKFRADRAGPCFGRGIRQLAEAPISRAGSPGLGSARLTATRSPPGLAHSHRAAVLNELRSPRPRNPRRSTLRVSRARRPSIDTPGRLPRRRLLPAAGPSSRSRREESCSVRCG
jgi:two-component sensor histidine kinase